MVFVPPHEKTTSYQPGDLLLTKSKEGNYFIIKILNIDKINLEKGKTYNIAGQNILVPEDDFFLCVAASFSTTYHTKEELEQVIKENKLEWHLRFTPMRPSGLTGEKGTDDKIGYQTVTDDDEKVISEYYLPWKEKFEKGEVGVF